MLVNDRFDRDLELKHWGALEKTNVNHGEPSRIFHNVTYKKPPGEGDPRMCIRGKLNHPADNQDGCESVESGN